MNRELLWRCADTGERLTSEELVRAKRTGYRTVYGMKTWGLHRRRPPPSVEAAVAVAAKTVDGAAKCTRRPDISKILLPRSFRIFPDLSGSLRIFLDLSGSLRIFPGGLFFMPRLCYAPVVLSPESLVPLARLQMSTTTTATPPTAPLVSR